MLDQELPTVSGLLSRAGYASSLIGKAHFQPLASQPDQTSLEAPPRLRDLDFWRDFHGPYYGFDHIELARNHADEAWAGQHYALWMESRGAGLEVPPRVQGLDQWPVWTGAGADVRDHALVENRHQPTRVHLRTYVEERYKITIHRDQPYGELFDLADDPGEHRNRFDDPAYAGVRAELAERFLNAELARERSRHPRIAIA